MADVIGGSVASSNNEISSLSDLAAGSAITESQIRALIARIDITLHNQAYGHGTFGGAEYEENGEQGFRIRTAEQARSLLEWRKQLVEALKDPSQLNDFAVLWSQWDSPDL